MGIEPTWSAWKAEVLPLNYIRKSSRQYKLYYIKPTLSTVFYKKRKKFNCLISHGVQDWDEYDSAMKDYNKWLEKDKQDEKINSIVDIYSNKLIEYIQKILPFGIKKMGTLTSGHPLFNYHH